MLGFEKKIKGLYRRLKTELAETTGPILADIVVLQAAKEDYLKRFVQLERFMDRLRASNTYGEPIVNFNEDSATKTEMQNYVAENIKKVVAKFKVFKRQVTETDAVLND